MTVSIRPATAEDRTFVISSWLDSQRTSYSAGLIAMEDWYKVQWPQYEKIIDRTDMRTLVAYEKRDPTFLYGFIVADPTEQRVEEKDGAVRWWPALVVYVFVKQNYRRTGIARRLFDAVEIDPEKPFLYASNTQQASRLASKVPLAKFHPLAVRFPKERKAA